jgi:hypothetical protein
MSEKKSKGGLRESIKRVGHGTEKRAFPKAPSQRKDNESWVPPNPAKESKSTKK